MEIGNISKMEIFPNFWKYFRKLEIFPETRFHCFLLQFLTPYFQFEFAAKNLNQSLGGNSNLQQEVKNRRYTFKIKLCIETKKFKLVSGNISNFLKYFRKYFHLEIFPEIYATLIRSHSWLPGIPIAIIIWGIVSPCKVGKINIVLGCFISFFAQKIHRISVFFSRFR